MSLRQVVRQRGFGVILSIALGITAFIALSVLGQEIRYKVGQDMVLMGGVNIIRVYMDDAQYPGQPRRDFFSPHGGSAAQDPRCGHDRREHPQRGHVQPAGQRRTDAGGPFHRCGPVFLRRPIPWSSWPAGCCPRMMCAATGASVCWGARPPPICTAILPWPWASCSSWARTSSRSWAW